MSTRQPRRIRVRFVGGLSAALLAIVVALGSGVGAAAEVQARTESDTDAARQLAERFVPVIMVKEQQEACDSEGEPFWPMSVDVLFGNPEVALRQVSRDDPVVMRAPTAADLVGLGEGFYLDFPGDSLRPGCVYESDFNKYTEEENPTVLGAAPVSPPPEKKTNPLVKLLAAPFKLIAAIVKLPVTILGRIIGGIGSAIGEILRLPVRMAGAIARPWRKQ